MMSSTLQYDLMSTDDLATVPELISLKLHKKSNTETII